MQAFDPKPAALHLAALERANHPIAHFGKYHGQFHFAGRLTRPLEEVAAAEVGAWMAEHPEGRDVSYEGTGPGSGPADPAVRPEILTANWRVAGAVPEYARAFRGRHIYVWTREAIARPPGSDGR